MFRSHQRALPSQSSYLFASLLLAMVATRQASAAETGLREFLRQRVAACAARDVYALKNGEDWVARRDALRGDLRSMLGLSPWPARGELHATITGTLERSGVVVEKLHFQSLPRLYVTANFYRPIEAHQPLPTILYLCGHARATDQGVSVGNKVAYQHHGAWFARNGYCCLIVDTLQLGEIEGIHHGTYREGMWWWIARGYTPAGVEAWNAIRALDYLETRPEVDRGRIGVTGRSGGGAYTWWTAALDDRPACIVPVAGITDLQNHVVDGCIEGHCDCMFMVNRLGWDFGSVAGLVAPRPCLLANTDKDAIFPLDGVVRIHASMRQMYRRLGAEDKLGLTIGEGPHKDTQELQLAAFRWFNRWLRGVDEPVTMVAQKLFTAAELKVFQSLPDSAQNALIHETFVPLPPSIDPPTDLAGWNTLRTQWLQKLQTESFDAWPKEAVALETKSTPESGTSLQHTTIDFTSEPGIRLRLTVVGSTPANGDAPIFLHLIGEDGTTFLDRTPEQVPEGETWAFLAPRGCDCDRSKEDARARTHWSRRFVLVGTTLDEGRVWDIRRSLAAMREADIGERPVILAARGAAAGLAVYASLFEADIAELRLQNPPASHRQGPIFINVLRVLDLPQAVALALPRRLTIRDGKPQAWTWPQTVSQLYQADRPLLTVEGMDR